MLLEGILRAEHFRHALDEGELLAFEEFLGAFLAVELEEFGLVIEELVLRGRAGHVQIDDALRLGGEVRHRGGERIGRVFLQGA